MTNVLVTLQQLAVEIMDEVEMAIAEKKLEGIFEFEKTDFAKAEDILDKVEIGITVSLQPVITPNTKNVLSIKKLILKGLIEEAMKGKELMEGLPPLVIRYKTVKKINIKLDTILMVALEELKALQEN